MQQRTDAKTQRTNQRKSSSVAHAPQPAVQRNTHFLQTVHDSARSQRERNAARDHKICRCENCIVSSCGFFQPGQQPMLFISEKWCGHLIESIAILHKYFGMFLRIVWPGTRRIPNKKSRGSVEAPTTTKQQQRRRAKP